MLLQEWGNSNSNSNEKSQSSNSNISFLITSKASQGSLKLGSTSFTRLCMNKWDFNKRSSTASEGLTVEGNLAWGSNRSDPCSRSPSLPLVRMCVALAHLSFSMWMRCRGRVERSRGKRAAMLWKRGVFHDRHWYISGSAMKQCSVLHCTLYKSFLQDNGTIGFT